MRHAESWPLPGTIVWGEDAPSWLAPVLTVLGAAATVAVIVMIDQPAAKDDAGTSLANVSSSPPPPPNVTTGREEPAPPDPNATAPASASPATLQRADAMAPCPPVLFAFERAAVYPVAAARPTVDALGTWLVAHPKATVLVEGHADASGSEDANLSLSRMRANAISSRLVELGVARSRITVRGFGSYQPVEGVPEEAASNRRVVAYVKGTAECPESTSGTEEGIER